MKKYTADFETTVDINDCRVWAYAICEIGNVDNFIHGNSMDDFLKWCSNPKENMTLYFHNLKFDGSFIMDYLFKNGYEWINDKKDRKEKTFTTLISGMGDFYSLEIYFDTKNKKKPNKVTIYDSLKILNFSVDKIAKSFNLPIRKLDLDYKEYREIGHVLTEHEIDYIRNDVEIMARALEIMFNEKLNKMTIGSDALNYYKSVNLNFNNYFPELDYETDQELRKSYRGGFTYLNPIYEGKEINNPGIVLDVNSLYPSVLSFDYMPIGKPIFYEGKYENDLLYPLYICSISCSFKLKDGKIPTLQIKNNFRYKNNEYLTTSNGIVETLMMTSVDLDLFFGHYEVKDLTYNFGWKFKRCKGLFTSYINLWTEKKIEAKKEGNGALYQIAKLMLNSLYGKFGKNPNVKTKIPYYEDEMVKYKISDLEIGHSCYLPIASFVTSYARRKTITTSQKIRDYSLNKYGIDYYIYSDTDSIHMLKMDESELKQFVEIDDYNLGWWKLESDFKRSKFIRQKCYIEEDYDGNINTAIAGMQKELGKYVNFENFDKGFSILSTTKDIKHKLTYKHVKGGVVLVDTDFSIK